MLKGKNILIGITGGIAAYKICELIRMFKRQNAQVKVVMTENALNFVTKLTLQNLTQNQVYTQQFDIKNFDPKHISLCDEADIFVLAPATADSISKIAKGIADNLLTTIACAFQKPIIIAPAMNTGMWNNKILQENIKKLKSKGITFIEPESGFLACGSVGKGRLAKIEDIFEKTCQILSLKQRLKGEKILVTAGGTREKIDSVRFISNYSSGKMGEAIADMAYMQGAEVVLITTNKTEKPYKTINVNSALEMQKAVEDEFKNSTYLFMTAAVADFRPKEISPQKIKKTEDNNEMRLNLIKNPDILKEICKIKTKNQTVIGFCAESENLEEFAKLKIQQKGCDLLVANDISRSDIGFSSDENEVLIVDKNLNIEKLEKNSKINIALKLLEKGLEIS